MEKATPAERARARALRRQYHERVAREVGDAQKALRARGASLEEYARGSFDVRQSLRAAERDYVPSAMRQSLERSDLGVPATFEGMVTKYMNQGKTRAQALRTVAENARTATNKAVDGAVFRRYSGE